MKADLLLKDGLIVWPDLGTGRGSVAVRDGKIAAILAQGEDLPAHRVIPCHGAWIMPGLIDPHTHFGFGAGDDDFRTESRSAALGGVTSYLSFHRSADLADSTPRWIAAGERLSCLDFGCHFGLTSLRHVAQLPEVMERFGVNSAKLYLMYKGASGAAKGFTEIDDGLLFAAMRQLASLSGSVLGVHCENVEVIPGLRTPLREAGRDDLAAWDEQSPDFLEAENVFRVGYFSEKTRCRVNIVHLSAGEGLDIVQMLRGRSHPAPIEVETCAHYLSLSTDSAAGLLGKVNPPLRGRRDVDALWNGIAKGQILTVGSDHVPRKRATKGPDIWQASAGFPGIATLLPVLITEGWHRRGIPPERLAAVTSANVAALYRIPGKGSMRVGDDADLVVVDPDCERVVQAATLESHSDYSPYEGMTLRGWPSLTVAGGRVMMENGTLTDEAETRRGRYLHRTSGAG
ncbi:amidohydrolase family protein [Gluconacetobacter sp. 1b LMG 1731]|uniref:Amidohydrolase family protein n=1 Tax=Gluconacetobacter dulcium TaxID=2729096 RepID=A0A7W4NW42_9PROT|nr:amidohydrolase family protein [Gluconacetobacter dulcium]MBB2165105.1 amidohydrolase family protein [Gluconacetobacter dulcium]MBB2194269.1 amidohydrolase family protein [Gluconacetobacter dulcium]